MTDFPEIETIFEKTKLVNLEVDYGKFQVFRHNNASAHARLWLLYNECLNDRSDATINEISLALPQYKEMRHLWREISYKTAIR